jgi:hypothetical protein
VIPEFLFRQLRYSLESLPTSFARLLFLASLRDPHTGQYIQEGWAMIASACEIHQALEETHREIFSDVVALPLAEFCRELKEQLGSLAQPECGLEKLWLEIESFRDMVPQGCSSVERNLFVSQMKLALEILIRAPEACRQSERAASARHLHDLPLKPRYLN